MISFDKNYLAEVRERIRCFLVSLRLRLHPKKNVISPVRTDIRFHEFRVLPTHRLLPKDYVRRFLRRIRAQQHAYAKCEIFQPEILQRMMSWSGPASQAKRCQKTNMHRRHADKRQFQTHEMTEPFGRRIAYHWE